MKKPKGIEVARFHANDIGVANRFADYLTNKCEHRFQIWEREEDKFALYWYIDMKGDEDDLEKAVALLEELFPEDLKLMGIFDFHGVCVNYESVGGSNE